MMLRLFKGEGMGGLADTTPPLKNTVGFNLIWKKKAAILLSKSNLFQIQVVLGLLLTLATNPGFVKKKFV